MTKGYRNFLVMMILLLILGMWIFIYGVNHPSRLPRLTPRNVSVAGYLYHG